MGDLEKMLLRSFKQTFFEPLDAYRWSRRKTDTKSNRMPLRGDFYLMSFERHGEIYPTDKGADHTADAPAHHSDEFPAGYSLAGCSPALPASASPASDHSSTALAQLWGYPYGEEFMNRLL